MAEHTEQAPEECREPEEEQTTPPEEAFEGGEEPKEVTPPGPLHYQVVMAYQQEDVAALVRTLNFRRHPEKNLRTATRIAYPIFGVVLIIVGLSVIAGIVGLGAFAPITIVSLLISVACVLGGVALFRRSDTKGMERRSWKKYPYKDLVYTYTFYENYFQEEDKISGRSKFQYISVRTANEDEGHFFLFTGNNISLMLRKDSFVQGDPAGFAAFLRKKAAVSIDPVE